MSAEVVSWSQSGTTIKVPDLELAEPVNGQLVVKLPNGETANQLDVQIVSNN
jgi:hypothetical protein